MAWVWFATGVLTGLLCLYWWNRAKEAERDVEELQKWLEYWQENSVELSHRLMAMEAAQGQAGPEPVARDDATAFMLAYQTFWHLMPEWQVRHD